MEYLISASQGAMRSLPGKIESFLLEPENGLRKGEKDALGLLKSDLREIIDSYLMEPSEVETPAFTANCWVKEVRELSYDIDDFIDKLVHDDANARIVARLRKKLNPRRRWITDEISGFRTRVKEAIQRHSSYNLDKLIFRPRCVSDEHRIRPLYGEGAAGLVDIDSPMNKLEEWLTGDVEQNLRVVSIVGFGGVGKTTLAKELYCKLGGRFECRAFVRTSRKPDARRLLTSILSQLRVHQPPDARAWGVDELIKNISTHLQSKRIFTLPESSSHLPAPGSDADSALAIAVSNHPRNPRVNVQGRSMVTKEKQYGTLEEHDEIHEEDPHKHYGTQYGESGEDENKQAGSMAIREQEHGTLVDQDEIMEEDPDEDSGEDENKQTGIRCVEMKIMGAIFKVVQEIAKAASTARRNRRRCLELAERVRTVGDLLRDSKAAKDRATRKRVLDRLRDALADALKLVDSCRRGGLLSRLLAAGRDAGRFDDVERRINNCLMDLGIAKDARLERQVNHLAARGNHPGTNAKGGSKKEINRNAKRKDVAMIGNKSSAAGLQQVATKGTRAGTPAERAANRRKRRRPPPEPGLRACAGHRRSTTSGAPDVSVEEDPNSCSVM